MSYFHPLNRIFMVFLGLELLTGFMNRYDKFEARNPRHETNPKFKIRAV